MTVLSAVLVIAIVTGLAIVAHFIITKFFAEPLKTISLIVVGLLLLALLVSQFFPEATNYRIWR